MSGRPWSAADRARLAELYPSLPTKRVAQLLDRPLTGVYATAKKLGIQKSEAFLDSPESGRLRKGQTRPGSEATQFPKGHVPLNKGLRRPGWGPGRMKETQFKKGVRSGIAATHWKPIGTILPDAEGYLRIKVREATYGKEATGFGNTKVWPLYSRYLWEQHNGPIPPKTLVKFKDGDRQNCCIENLHLISMADNARLNRMWGRFPPELSAAIQLNGALKRKLRRLDGKEQNQRSA